MNALNRFLSLRLVSEVQRASLLGLYRVLVQYPPVSLPLFPKEFWKKGLWISRWEGDGSMAAAKVKSDFFLFLLQITYSVSVF